MCLRPCGLNAAMTDSPKPLPAVGLVARVAVEGELQDAPASHGKPWPAGVFVGLPGVLILSTGPRALALRFSTADDAGRLAAALLSVAQTMETEAARAAERADDALARVLAEREAAGNG